MIPVPPFSGSVNDTTLSGVSVLVAGAGLAGLAAARDLIARGATVTVIDVRDRVGGRVWTIREGFAEGQHAEAGALWQQATGLLGQLAQEHPDVPLYSQEQARALATIEPTEVSMAKVAGLLQAPVAKIGYLLQAPLQRIAYALAERGRQAA